ncbi:MAG TPA: metallophosphoesterase family protein [Gaiellaceae bacterium]|jgi:putative phosphoesterase|nr:metallophosphoesterase family protein [Gaiellaceae bacterium]
MRVAALCDVHGNLAALEAVLAEVEAEGVDAIVFGGDLAAGPQPAETLARIEVLGDGAICVRGNGDREPGDWVSERLSEAERRFLATLPDVQRLDVDGIGPTLFCHGSPRSDTEILTVVTTDERLREILAGVSERLVVCGHTHHQFDRVVDGVRVVNAGAVGMAYEGRPGAYWALLGPDVELRRTEYDYEAVAEAFRTSGFPDGGEHARTLFEEPPSALEVARHFERLALEAVS